MKQGDVWKYGETIQGKGRYNSNSYEATNFEMQPIFYGTKTEILIQEKNNVVLVFFSKWAVASWQQTFSVDYIKMIIFGWFLI